MLEPIGRYLSPFIRSGVQKEKHIENQKSIVLVNQVALLFIGISIPFMSVFVALGYWKLACISLPFVGMYMGCVLLNRWGYFVSAQLSLMLGISTPIYVYASVLGERSGIQYAALILATFSFGIFKESQKILRIAGLATPIFIFYLLYYTHFRFFYRASIPSDQLSLIYFSSMTLLFVMLFFITRFYTKLTYQHKANISQLLSLYGLTPREGEIIFKLAEGKKNKEISRELFIEEGTVKSHLSAIFRKIEVNSRTELMAILMRGRPDNS